MKWTNLLNLIADEPVFSSSILKAGNAKPSKTQVQLIRWVKAGKIIQLRRGLYALAEPYRKTNPHPFLVSNRMKKASYVSLQSALAHHGLIPEYVPVVTSVTTGRPEHLRTELGSFTFRHIKKAAFKGFQKIEVSTGQFAFIASPEKALADLLYLTPGSEREAYLVELRLQNLDKIDQSELFKISQEFRSLKLLRAVKKIIRLTQAEKREEL
jgi:predicted transcriptional regulator of viral defense system